MAGAQVYACYAVTPLTTRQKIRVTFLGDGEFDGIDLQADLRALKWSYVCRTASNIVVTAHGVRFHVRDLGPSRSEMVAVSLAWMTALSGHQSERSGCCRKAVEKTTGY
jgi:hypothetical protein